MMNPQMPYLYGDAEMLTSHFDYLVEIDQPMMSIEPTEPDLVSRAIGINVAEQIEDSLTLQLGIGGIPGGRGAWAPQGPPQTHDLVRDVLRRRSRLGEGRGPEQGPAHRGQLHFSAATNSTTGSTTTRGYVCYVPRRRTTRRSSPATPG